MRTEDNNKQQELQRPNQRDLFSSRPGSSNSKRDLCFRDSETAESYSTSPRHLTQLRALDSSQLVMTNDQNQVSLLPESLVASLESAFSLIQVAGVWFGPSLYIRETRLRPLHYVQ